MMKTLHMFGLPISMILVIFAGKAQRSQANIMPRVGIPIMGLTFWFGSLAFEVMLMPRRMSGIRRIFKVVYHTLMWIGVLVFLSIMIILGQIRTNYQSEDALFIKLMPLPAHIRQMRSFFF